MTIALASDHGGLKLKNAIKAHLEEKGIAVLDEGTFDESSVDYPLFAKKAAEDVAQGKAELGILTCTSGEGVAITANKVKGIRCGIGYSDNVSAKCREHNNCNMIAFGQAEMETPDVLRRVDIFLNAKFEGGRHQRRVGEINDIESNC